MAAMGYDLDDSRYKEFQLDLDNIKKSMAEFKKKHDAFWEDMKKMVATFLIETKLPTTGKLSRFEVTKYLHAHTKSQEVEEDKKSYGSPDEIDAQPPIDCEGDKNFIYDKQAIDSQGVSCMQEIKEGKGESAINFEKEDDNGKGHMYLKLVATHMFDERSVLHINNKSRELSLLKQPVTSYMSQNKKSKLILDESVHIVKFYTMVNLCESGVIGKFQAMNYAFSNLKSWGRKLLLSCYLQGCKESLLDYISCVILAFTTKLEYESNGVRVLCPFDPGGVKLLASKFVLETKNYTREATIELQSLLFMESNLTDANKRFQLLDFNVVQIFKCDERLSYCFRFLGIEVFARGHSTACANVERASLFVVSCSAFLCSSLYMYGAEKPQKISDSKQDNNFHMSKFILADKGGSSLLHRLDFTYFSSDILMCDFQSCYVEDSTQLFGTTYKQSYNMSWSKSCFGQELLSNVEGVIQQAKSIQAGSFEKVMQMLKAHGYPVYKELVLEFGFSTRYTLLQLLIRTPLIDGSSHFPFDPGGHNSSLRTRMISWGEYLLCAKLMEI